MVPLEDSSSTTLRRTHHDASIRTHSVLKFKSTPLTQNYDSEPLYDFLTNASMMFPRIRLYWNEQIFNIEDITDSSGFYIRENMILKLDNNDF